MNKKIMTDIIVNKKSIRQIPITVKRRIPSNGEGEEEKANTDRTKRNIKEKRAPNWQRRPLNPKFMIWFIAILCLLALFFGVSMIFSSATVIITPRIEEIIFTDDIYSAELNATIATDLSFEVLNVKQTIGETVEATEEKEVSQKASGKIIIYNNYSSVSQRLINNTRFEANNGKVYRINSSVVVPGLTKVNGKTIPGSVEATVYADQPGEGYNLKMSDLTGDFKVPGFKGDPRYDSFYARLKEDIQGGFIGKQRIVNDELRKVTEEILKAKLREQLLKELYAIKPENYLLFKDGYSINYSRALDTAVDSDKVKVNMDGTISGIVFNNSKFTNYIGTRKINGFDGLPVEISNQDDLIVIFTADDMTNLSTNKKISIKLNGQATIKWIYDENTIKKDLAGKKEADLKNLAERYKKSVLSIKVIFRPVWTRYFPDNLNKIKIKEEIL